jgi:hypothetical protein
MGSVPGCGAAGPDRNVATVILHDLGLSFEEVTNA